MLKKLYVFVGEMGSGKTTIAQEVSIRTNIPIVRTTTSRPMRENETEKDYKFVDNSHFKNNLDKFLEYKVYDTIYGKWWYGLSIDNLNEIKCEEAIVILTPSGYCDLINKCNNIETELFYISTDEATRYERVLARGDSPREIMRRFKTDKSDFKVISKLKTTYIDNNMDLDIVVNKTIELMGRTYSE